MKIYFLLGLAFISQLSIAQSKKQYQDKLIKLGLKSNKQLQFNTSSPKKTRVLDRRIIGDASSIYFLGTLIIDSNTYSYSGTRGSELKNDSPIFNFIESIDYNLEAFTNENTNIHFDNTNTGSALPDTMSKFVKTYDAMNRLTDKVEYYYNSPIFEASSRTQYVYDANSNIVSEIYQLWNSSTSAYENYERYLRTYNLSNLLLSEKKEISNSLNGTWTKNYEQYYGYNALNHIILDSLLDGYDTTTANHTARQVQNITYSTNSLQAILRNWNDTLSQYEYTSKIDANLNGNHILNSIFYNFDKITNTFVLSDLDTLIYNGANKISMYKNTKFDGTIASITSFIYNAQNQVVKSSNVADSSVFSTTFSYDSFNQLTNMKDSVQSSPSSPAEQWLDKSFYYETYENGKPNSIEESSLIQHASLYPNPSSVYSYVSYTTTEAVESELEVLDSSGKVIYTINVQASLGDHLEQLPLSNLHNGIYLVNINIKGQTQKTLKLIKQ
jgi:hypothetical protein